MVQILREKYHNIECSHLKVIPKTAYTAGTMFYLVGILHQNYKPDILANT
jgi:hypothetical protein